ncbi:MAG: thiamine phosphate synthase [Crocinitomicaceae bacterium]
MSKIILISPEQSVVNEISLVQAMMSTNEDVRFHLRKFRWSKEDYLDYLLEINPLFYPKISIHQFHDLQLNFPKIGLHYKEEDRDDFGKSTMPTSTSFHSQNDAFVLGNEFDYFFCSPVFQSLSKKDYLPTENWDITAWNNELRRKAVALGGISVETIIQAKELGFTNFAVLGNIWMSENPLKSFEEMHELCQK